MKRIWIAMIIVMLLSAATAMAQQNDALFDDWIEYCCGYEDEDGEYHNLAREAFEDGTHTLNGRKVEVGMTVDGWDVDAFTTTGYTARLYGMEGPCTAEMFLTHFPIEQGAPGWTYGILKDVDYRYGVSEVRLIGSCLKSYTYNDGNWTFDDLEIVIYEFEIRTDGKVYDLIVGPDPEGGPDWNCGLRPGSDTLTETDGSTDVLGAMWIVNCNEWVSLRAAPDTGSECIRRVGLGDIVMAYKTKGEFTACNIDGIDGWILTKYLDKAWENLADFECEYLRKHSWRG